MKEIKITLSGNPISTQGIYKSACRGNKPWLYMTQTGKKRKADYQWQAKAQYRGEVLTCPLSVEIDLYFRDKRKHDWDNYHKLSIDSLEGIVYANDVQIREAVVRKHLDPENPRIEIIIK